jgi:hypothetical protein
MARAKKAAAQQLLGCPQAGAIGNLNDGPIGSRLLLFSLPVLGANFLSGQTLKSVPDEPSARRLLGNCYRCGGMSPGPT